MTAKASCPTARSTRDVTLVWTVKQQITVSCGAFVRHRARSEILGALDAVASGLD
jgi:hypothetical protein